MLCSVVFGSEVHNSKGRFSISSFFVCFFPFEQKSIQHRIYQFEYYGLQILYQNEFIRVKIPLLQDYKAYVLRENMCLGHSNEPI